MKKYYRYKGEEKREFRIGREKKELEPDEVVELDPEVVPPRKWFEPAEDRPVRLKEFKYLLMRALRDPEIELLVMEVLYRRREILRKHVKRAIFDED